MSLSSDPMNFSKLLIEVPTAFVRHCEINAYTKLIVMIEHCYCLAIKESGDSKKFPDQAEIAKYIGTCRQTVSTHMHGYGYDIYSPTHMVKIWKKHNPYESRELKEKKSMKILPIPARLIIECVLNLHERLILVYIMTYIAEGIHEVSIAQIGKDLGISRRSADTHVKSLIENKLLIKSLTQTANVGSVFSTFDIPADFLDQLTEARMRAWAKC